MRIREMRELSRDELAAAVDETRKELVGLRFDKAARKLDNTAKLRQTKKKLAQLLTVQHQMQTQAS